MIYLTGDTHTKNKERVIDLLRENMTFSHLNNEDKVEYLIVLGDCGILWSEDKQEEDIKILEEALCLYERIIGKKLIFLFLAGNHENFDLLEKCEREKRFGSEVGVVGHNIFHLLTGEVYTIEEKTFAIFGGAFSIDKDYRIEGLDWWSQEIPSYETCEKFLEKINKIDSIDYFLTHTTSNLDLTYFDMYPFTGKKTDPVAEFLKIFNLVNDKKFKHHYFGHFHMDKTVEATNSTCLYTKILKVGEKI